MPPNAIQLVFVLNGGGTAHGDTLKKEAGMRLEPVMSAILTTSSEIKKTAPCTVGLVRANREWTCPKRTDNGTGSQAYVGHFRQTCNKWLDQSMCIVVLNGLQTFKP